jgi:hypothetical protein
MKKLIPFVVLLVGVTGALAQTIDFNQNRTFTTTADRTVTLADGTHLVGTNFAALLYYQATAGATSLTPVPQINRFRNLPTTDPLAGTWVGATRTLSGRAAGDNVTLQVKVWDTTQFATPEAAAAAGGLWGESAAFTYNVPPAGSLPSAFYIENFRGFSLIPEPSVIGLGVIGIGALFLLRRRK